MSSSSIDRLGQQIGPLYKVVVAKFQENVGGTPTSKSAITRAQFASILSGAWQVAYSQRATKEAAREWSRLEKHTVDDLWKQAFRGGSVKRTLDFSDLLGLFLDGSGVPPTPEQKYAAQAARNESTDSFTPLARLVDHELDGAALTATALRRAKVLESRCGSLIKLLKQSDDENLRLQKQVNQWAADGKAALRLSARRENARLAELEEERSRFSAEKSGALDLHKQNEDLKKALADAKAKCKKFAKLVKSKKGMSASAVKQILQFEADAEREERDSQRQRAAEAREEERQHAAAESARAPTLSVCRMCSVTIEPAAEPVEEEDEPQPELVSPTREPAPARPRAREPAPAAAPMPEEPAQPAPSPPMEAAPKEVTPEPDPFAAPPSLQYNDWGTPLQMPQVPLPPAPETQEETYETNPATLFGSHIPAAQFGVRPERNAAPAPPAAQLQAPAPAPAPYRPAFPPYTHSDLQPAPAAALPEPIRRAGGPRKPPMRLAGSAAPASRGPPSMPIRPPEPARNAAPAPAPRRASSEPMPGPPPVVRSTPYPAGIAAPPGLFSNFSAAPFASGGFPVVGGAMPFGGGPPLAVNPIAPPPAFQQSSQPHYMMPPGGIYGGAIGSPMRAIPVLPMGQQFANQVQANGFMTLSPNGVPPVQQWSQSSSAEPAQSAPKAKPQPIAPQQPTAAPLATSAPVAKQSYSAPVRAPAASQPRSAVRPPMKKETRIPKPQSVAPAMPSRKAAGSWAAMIGSRKAPPAGFVQKSAGQNGATVQEAGARRPPKRTAQPPFTSSWADMQDAAGDEGGLWTTSFAAPSYESGSSRQGQRNPIARAS